MSVLEVFFELYGKFFCFLTIIHFWKLLTPCLMLKREEIFWWILSSQLTVIFRALWSMFLLVFRKITFHLYLYSFWSTLRGLFRILRQKNLCPHLYSFSKPFEAYFKGIVRKIFNPLLIVIFRKVWCIFFRLFYRILTKWIFRPHLYTFFRLFERWIFSVERNLLPL